MMRDDEQGAVYVASELVTVDRPISIIYVHIRKPRHEANHQAPHMSGVGKFAGKIKGKVAVMFPGRSELPYIVKWEKNPAFSLPSGIGPMPVQDPHIRRGDE
jgi:hypothetical protein